MKLDTEPRLGGLPPILIDWARAVVRAVNYLSDAFDTQAVKIAALQNGPAFSAYLSSNQTGVTAATFTKVSFNAEQFDTAGCFDISTGRFTPNVPGYYQLNASVTIECTAGAFTNVQLSIYKNGVSARRLEASLANNSSVWQSTGGALIQMNGTTDYLEVFHYTSGGTGVQYDGDALGLLSHFSGFLARGA